MNAFLQQIIAALIGAAVNYVSHKFGPNAGAATGDLLTSTITAGVVTGAVARVFHYKTPPSSRSSDNIGNP